MFVSSDVNVTDRFTRYLNSKGFWRFVSEFVDVLRDMSLNFLKREVKGTVSRTNLIVMLEIYSKK